MVQDIHHWTQKPSKMSLMDVIIGKSGLHLPAKLYDKDTDAPQKCLIILKVIFVAIFRFIYMIASNIVCTVYYFTCVALLEPLRHIAEPVYWRGVGYVFRWLQLIVGCWMWTAGYKVQICGDDLDDIKDKRTLVLVNHQSTADVPALMYAFQFTDRILRNVLWIMDILFKYSDFGLISQHRGDFFIQQGKSTRHLQDGLLRKHLEEVYVQRGREWLIVFPEGGFLWKLKEMSQAYGKKHGFPHLEHCSLPRAGAVQTILETLNCQKNGMSDELSNIKWILDVTVAYPYTKPLNMQTILFGQRDPVNVTLHYRKIPISQVPLGSPEALRDWLFTIYQEKDKMLDAFYQTGKFPVPANKGDKYMDEPKMLEFSLFGIIAMNVAFTLVALFGAYGVWSILGVIMNLIW